MEKKFDTINDVQQFLLDEIAKNTHVENLDINDNLFDPKYENKIDPITMVYAFSNILNAFSISAEDILTNYSFDKFSVNSLSEILFYKYN